MNRIQTFSGSTRISCSSNGGTPSDQRETRAHSSRDGSLDAVDAASTAVREARVLPCTNCQCCCSKAMTQTFPAK
jgi:hypothetical protein